MIEHLRRLFRSPAPAPPARRPRVPQGTRYYVIGDIHGRLDLFEALIAAIEHDDANTAPAQTTVILLGDLVDRGPHSAQVIARAREWQQQRRVRVLAGNHEEMFLAALAKPEALRHFLKHGGFETIVSFGLAPAEMARMELEEIFALLPGLIPADTRSWLAGFETLIVAGDYAFVHAGIDPARPLAQQRRTDLLWIREGFLTHKGPLEKVVVHGHTIFDRVMDCGNRIGIDTGAFRTGVLTALVLEGDRRRYLQACAAEAGGPVEIVRSDDAAAAVPVG